MDRIQITMFNDFTITYHNQTISFDKEVTKKMSSLLQLIIYHSNGIRKDELVNELWKDSANPFNNLKHSIFRLRTVLNEVPLLQGMELISTIKNGYIFAPAYTIETDYMAVDHSYEVIMHDNSKKDEIFHHAENIISIYKGMFFVNDHAKWSLQVRAYYQNIYEKAFSIVCEQYLEEEKYMDLIPIIQHAISVDEFHDEAYVYYMKVLHRLGDIKAAISLYQFVSNLYEQELGQFSSTEIKAIYKSITKREDIIVEVESLKEKLNRNLTTATALYCDFDTFQQIYHTALKNAQRDKKRLFLMSFQFDGDIDNKKQYHYMMKLKSIMCQQLRSGDVLTKINRSQMIALLPCKSLDDGYNIIHRITSSFYKKVNKDHARLHYFISMINDVDQDIFKKV